MLNFKSQKGDVEFLILLVVIIGAFILAGGQYIFDTLPKGNSSAPNTAPAPADEIEEDEVASSSGSTTDQHLPQQ